MSTFDTPEPISAHIEVGIGDIRVTAGDRTDTVVEVQPSDPNKNDDVTAAERARVEFADGTLEVRALRRWKSLSPFSDGGSVNVTVELPTGSRLKVESAMGALRCAGRVGDCSVKTSMGSVGFEETGALKVNTAMGDVTIGHAVGDTEIITSSSTVRAERIDGAVVLKKSNGDTWLGEVTGDIKLNTANGNFTVRDAHAGVDAKTANGSVRVDAVRRGVVRLETACGDVRVGIAEGTAARLDVSTRAGSVRNDLPEADGPRSGEDTAEITARTMLGDIVIRRAEEEN